jgi:hypothetical protein
LRLNPLLSLVNVVIAAPVSVAGTGGGGEGAEQSFECGGSAGDPFNFFRAQFTGAGANQDSILLVRHGVSPFIVNGPLAGPVFLALAYVAVFEIRRFKGAGSGCAHARVYFLDFLLAQFAGARADQYSIVVV